MWNIIVNKIWTNPIQDIYISKFTKIPYKYDHDNTFYKRWEWYYSTQLFIKYSFSEIISCIEKEEKRKKNQSLLYFPFICLFPITFPCQYYSRIMLFFFYPVDSDFTELLLSMHLMWTFCFTSRSIYKYISCLLMSCNTKWWLSSMVLLLENGSVLLVWCWYAE